MAFLALFSIVNKLHDIDIRVAVTNRFGNELWISFWWWWMVIYRERREMFEIDILPFNVVGVGDE